MTPAWVRNRALVSGLVFLATLLVGFPAVQWGTFHFDDGHSIVDNEGIRSLANVPRFFADPQLWSAEPGNAMYRPVLLVSFALDHALWGYAPSGWVLTNVVVHALVAALVHRLALRLGLSDAAALFAGAVMALHPAASETLNYVSSRSESLAALVMLGALHLHLTARESSGARRAAFAAGAAVVSGLAVLAKETTAGFFAAVVLLELVAPRAPLRSRLARAAAFGALYAAALAAVLLLRRDRLGVAVATLHFAHAPTRGDAQVGGGRSVLENLVTQSRVVVLYLRTYLLPVRLNVDHDVRVLRAMEPSAWAACAVHAATVAAAVVARVRGRRLLPLCVGWFWLFLAPSVVIPLNVVMNEHRLYLPAIAVSLLAGAALARVAEAIAARAGSWERGLAAAAAPLALFVPLHVQRAHEWRSDESLWTVAVERAPLSGRAHLHLGAVWHTKANQTYDLAERRRLLDLALAEYARSDALHPRWSDLQLNIGNARLTRGRITKDPADFEAALAAYRLFGDVVGPRKPRPRYLQAIALSELGRHELAASIVRELDLEDPARTTMYDDMLARILRRAGDARGACEAMERVVAIEEPEGRVGGLLDLAWWRFEDGDLAGAQALIQRALAVAEKHPREFKPYLWAARFLVLTGRRQEAEEMFRLARRHGWSAPVEEVRWVAGGPTPGVATGTRGGSAAPATGR